MSQRKIYELYISKRITLVLPYRNKTRKIPYMVISAFGTEDQMQFKLKSIKYPCEIPHMENITIEV